MKAVDRVIIFVHFLLKTISKNTFTHDLNFFGFSGLFIVKSITYTLIRSCNCLILSGENCEKVIDYIKAGMRN